jgi:DNA-binding transcriptional LysR family regulator
MDRLDELAVFTAIVETGSLAAAARKLRRSPPAVTRVLAALEERLATRLVERTTRKLSLTDAGRRFADRAGAVLGAYDEAIREAGSDLAPRGLLRVTAPVVFGARHVTPILMAIQGEYPALQVELVLSDRNLDMIDEGLDAAVRIGTLADSTLVARRVGRVSRVIVASPSYISAQGCPAAPADLASHHLIYTASRPEPVAWRFQRDGRMFAVPVNPRMIINQVDATLSAARAGHGIASALSYQVAEDVAAGRLLRLLTDWEPAPMPVQLVVPSGQHLPARTRLFMTEAARNLSALPVIQL